MPLAESLHGRDDGRVNVPSTGGGQQHHNQMPTGIVLPSYITPDPRSRRDLCGIQPREAMVLSQKLSARQALGDIGYNGPTNTSSMSRSQHHERCGAPVDYVDDDDDEDYGEEGYESTYNTNCSSDGEGEAVTESR